MSTFLADVLNELKSLYYIIATRTIYQIYMINNKHSVEANLEKEKENNQKFFFFTLSLFYLLHIIIQNPNLNSRSIQMK